MAFIDSNPRQPFLDTLWTLKKQRHPKTQLKDSLSEEMMRQMGGLGGAGAQAGGVGAAEMGDMTKKAYQRPTLDDLDIEEEEEDDMPDLE